MNKFGLMWKTAVLLQLLYILIHIMCVDVFWSIINVCCVSMQKHLHTEEVFLCPVIST